MDEHLKKLVYQRRDEKCPPRVLEEVFRQIDLESAGRRTFPLFRLVTAFAAIALLIALPLLKNEPTQTAENPPQVSGLSEAEKRRVIEDTELAFASIGHLLIQAGNSSAAIISEQMTPPLSGSFQTIKDTIIN